MDSPYIVESFRKYDAALISDGGRALIITSIERAKDLKNSIVTIMGIGVANPSTDIHQADFLDGNTGDKRACDHAIKHSWKMQILIM